MHEVVTNNFDLWTSALLTKSTAGRGSNGRNEAYGIKKLRELILELAARGMLVPQDPNDEPVDVLLEKIAKKKTQLIKERRIRQEKALPAIEAEDVPYPLPTSWAWARLPDIASYKPGKTPPTNNPSYWSEDPADVAWASISDMEHLGVLTETSKRVTNKAAESVFGYEPIPKGSLLMSFKLTLGKMAILGADAYHNEAIISIQPYCGVVRNYLLKVLPMRAREGNTKRAIMGATLNASSLALLLVPLPPLAEQHRIVAKVDELMALCDQLEQQQTGSIEAHQALVETLLGTLTRVESQQELAEAWTRIGTHFDNLFSTEHSIEKLRQTILQLAVMGKLVSQDPSDEPASVLVKRFLAQRFKTVKEGAIESAKQVDALEEDEKFFELPQGWTWVRFDHIAEDSKNALKAGPFGSALKKSMYVEAGYKIYGQEQVISGDENYGDYYINQEKYDSLRSCAVKPGDILVSLVGTIGKVLVLSKKSQPGIINPRLVKLSLNGEIFRPYIQLMLASPLIQDELNEKSHGGTMDILNLRLIRSLSFPLPPTNEQRRIVAKLDELMALCDALNAHIADARTTQIQLADAIVDHAVV